MPEPKLPIDALKKAKAWTDEAVKITALAPPRGDDPQHAAAVALCILISGFAGAMIEAEEAEEAERGGGR